MSKPNTVIIQVEPMYLGREEAAAFLALSVSTFEGGVRTGAIPKPRMLSKSRVGWLVSELRQFAMERPVSDLPPPKNCEHGRPRASQRQLEAEEAS